MFVCKSCDKDCQRNGFGGCLINKTLPGTLYIGRTYFLNGRQEERKLTGELLKMMILAASFGGVFAVLFAMFLVRTSRHCEFCPN